MFELTEKSEALAVMPHALERIPPTCPVSMGIRTIKPDVVEARLGGIHPPPPTPGASLPTQRGRAASCAVSAHSPPLGGGRFWVPVPVDQGSFPWKIAMFRPPAPSAPGVVF